MSGSNHSVYCSECEEDVSDSYEAHGFMCPSCFEWLTDENIDWCVEDD